MNQLYPSLNTGKHLKNLAKFLAFFTGALFFQIAANAQIMYPGTPIGSGSAAGDVVWRWTSDSCSAVNIPDAPVRAYRDSSGQINLTIPHYVNYRLKGNSFSTLTPDCDAMLVSEHLTDPSLHRSAQWIQSLYTEDGKTVHAILHNENFDAGGYGTGNYYSTSACYAFSTNGGGSFVEPAFPDNVIFSPSGNTTGRPFAPIGHDGLEPFSNIIKKDGYYYFYGYISLADHTLMTPANSPLYLFRSDNLGDAHAWRGWDGNDFTVQLGNAYTDQLDLSNLKGVGEGTPWDGATALMGTNVTWNTYFNKFMMIGISSKSGVPGIYYALSDDLLNWSNRVPLKLFNTSYQMGFEAPIDPLKRRVTYATVIDHDDTSRNFEVTDSTIYLYWVESDPSAFGTWYSNYARTVRRQAFTLTKNIVSEFVVTSRLDIDDANNGDGLARGQNGANFVNTLRAALSESASRPPYSVNDTLRIRFNIPGSNQTINLSSDLPASFRVGIDGSTQSGTTLSTSFLPNGMNLQPKIIIQGGLLPLRANDSYIKNIQAESVYLYGDRQSITHSIVQDLVIDGNRTIVGGVSRNNQLGKLAVLSDTNTVAYNFIGLDQSGTGSIATDSDPILRIYGSNNEINNNLIGGAQNQAVQIEPDSVNQLFAKENLLINNYIGIGPDATTQGYIQSDGIEIKNGANSNILLSNYISGAENGIYIANSDGNQMVSNTLGSLDLGNFNGNRNAGIWITGTSRNNLIGMDDWSAGNFIAHNGQSGIDFLNLTGEGNIVSKNYIFNNPSAALRNPGAHQPNKLLPYSAYVNANEDSLFVGCIADTFSKSGLYLVEFYQTNAVNGFSDAELLIASGAFTANQLNDFQVAINEQNFDLGFNYLTMLIIDPDGNTSALSDRIQIMRPDFTPEAEISNDNLNTSQSNETINIEITNNGNADLNWSISGNEWANAEPNSGSISGGSSAVFGITLSRGVICGALSDTLYIINNSISNDSIPVYVSMNPRPNANITYTSSLTFCPGGSVLLRGTPGNDAYQWFKNNVALGVTTPNYLANTEGSYFVVITSGACIDTSDAVTVSVGGSLSASISVVGSPTVCGGSPVVMNANMGAGYAYQWYQNNNLIGGATSSSYSTNAPGSYTVRISANGCNVTSSPVNITPGGAPPANASSTGATTFCAGGSVILNANTGAGLTYQWQKDGVDIPGAIANQYSATTQGQYRVRVTNNGCSSVSAPITVTVNSAPSATASATSPTTICEGGSVTFNANAGAGLSYQWMLNGNDISSANSADFTSTSAGSYSVRVTSNGCSSVSLAIPVTVNSSPSATASATSPTTICEGGSVSLNANAGAGLSYQWMLDGNDISSANSVNYSALTAGSYSVRVTSNGCSAVSSAIPVTVNSAPSATASAISPTTICEGGSVTFNANAGAGLSYQWMLDGNDISSANSINYSALTAGSYSVRVTSNGCSAVSSAIPVTVNSAPSATASATSPTTICEGGSVTLNANAGAGLSYQWMLNGNDISSANSANFTATSAGSYSVRVTSNGCSSVSAPVTVTVNSAPSATASATSPTTICDGGSVSLNANAGAGLSYQWMLNGNDISTANSAGFTATSAGSYSVRVTSNGCSEVSEGIIVELIPMPSAPEILVNGDYIYSNSTLDLIWYINGEEVIGYTADSIEITEAGIYSCYINSNGCVSEFSNEIIITPLSLRDEKQLDIHVYPNPSTGIFYFTGNDLQSIQVYNHLGALILSIDQLENSVDLSQFSNGIYHLKINAGGTSVRRSIVVQQ